MDAYEEMNLEMAIRDAIHEVVLKSVSEDSTANYQAHLDEAVRKIKRAFRKER